MTDTGGKPSGMPASQAEPKQGSGKKGSSNEYYYDEEDDSPAKQKQ